MKLRDYQREATVNTIDYLDNNQGNPIVALPTGTGKSLVIAALLRYYTQHKNERCLVLTHVKELIEQNYKTAARFIPNFEAGIYSAGLNRRDTEQQIIFGGIQSVHKADLGSFDKIIIDECHLVPDDKNTMYRRYISTQEAPVIGLSATPYRLKGGLLVEGKIFNGYSYNKTDLHGFNWFVDNGYLCPLVAYESAVKMDVSKVHIRGGEFIASELQKAVDKASLTKSIITDLIQRAEKRSHWLIFTTGIEHCENVAGELARQGVATRYVHSKISIAQRDSAIDDFRRGHVRAIVNSNILTTGFDVPHIDCIATLRPMLSPSLWVQSLGRGTRPFKDKSNTLVLDYAGNTKRLGPINDVILPNTRKAGKGSGQAPVRTCPKCRALNNLQANECVGCGYVFPKPSKLKAAASNLEIIARKKREPKKDLVLTVSRVVYSKHINNTVSLKITYYCGVRPFREWIFPETHQKFIWYRAVNWWRKRTDLSCPKTVDKCLDLVKFLKKPKKIVVDVNGKYPQIKDYFF